VFALGNSDDQDITWLQAIFAWLLQAWLLQHGTPRIFTVFLEGLVRDGYRLPGNVSEEMALHSANWSVQGCMQEPSPSYA